MLYESIQYKPTVAEYLTVYRTSKSIQKVKGNCKTCTKMLSKERKGKLLNETIETCWIERGGRSKKRSNPDQPEAILLKTIS